MVLQLQLFKEFHVRPYNSATVYLLFHLDYKNGIGKQYKMKGQLKVVVIALGNVMLDSKP